MIVGILLFLCCVVACLIGSISGLGGGIIIKPIVDSLNIMDLQAIGFLSNCTVFTMAIMSLYRNKKSKIKLGLIPIFLGIGAIIGGIIGKKIFTIFSEIFSNNIIGKIQYIMLLVMNSSILIYVLNKTKIKSKIIKSKVISIVFGISLGIISTFLGIGGGPLNIAILYYFYSLDAKKATMTSLVIVFFSQLSSLATTIIEGVPEFKILHLFVMCFGAIIGGLIGGNILKKLDNSKTQSFFVKVLIFLIGLNIFNLLCYFEIINF